MFGPCLVMLLGGAPDGAALKPVWDPAEQRIFRAVVVAPEALDGATRTGDSPNPDTAAQDQEDAGLPATLTTATVIRPPAPAKEP